MVKEFKAFALRGNVLDLAIGMVMGAAFTAIVKSFVDDIIMKILGIFIGKMDFSKLQISIAPDLAITYGNFIQAVIQFVLISLSLFLVIKIINKFHRKEEIIAEETISNQEVLLTEIRDLIKKESELKFWQT